MRSIPLVLVILWFFLVIPFITGIAGRRRDFGHHHLHRLRGGLLLRDHALGHPERAARPGQCCPFALGLGRAQAMIHVILPQAVRNMLPVLLTQTIVLFQDTSLVYAIGAKDMLKAADVVGKNYNRPVEMIVLSALIYFAICFSLSLAVRQLQKRVAIIR
jgi:glutamate/aspartate transport system permease protein